MELILFHGTFLLAHSKSKYTLFFTTSFGCRKGVGIGLHSEVGENQQGVVYTKLFVDLS